MNFNPAFILFLIALVANAPSYWWGFNRGEAYESAIRDQAAAELLIEQEQALREEYERQIAIGVLTVRELRAEKAAITQQANELTERIAYVTEHYRPAPAAAPEPRPECIFTNGFVGLWNDAIGAGVSAPGDSAGADGAASTTGTAAADPLGISGVKQPDTLANIITNGSRCQQLEAQLNGLIDHLEQIQGKD